MAISTQASTTITITLPEWLAEKAEALAEHEGRTISELFCEAFRAYQKGVFEREWEELHEYAKTRNPHGFTEADIPRLIKEVRAEMAAEEALDRAVKAS